MAWYDVATIRYRGRLVEVTLRYGVYHAAHVIKGKPLDLPFADGFHNQPHVRREILRIERLAKREVRTATQETDQY